MERLLLTRVHRAFSLQNDFAWFPKKKKKCHVEFFPKSTVAGRSNVEYPGCISTRCFSVHFWKFCVSEKVITRICD